jgi:hypothetical protein
VAYAYLYLAYYVTVAALFLLGYLACRDQPPKRQPMDLGEHADQYADLEVWASTDDDWTPADVPDEEDGPVESGPEPEPAGNEDEPAPDEGVEPPDEGVTTVELHPLETPIDPTECAPLFATAAAHMGIDLRVLEATKAWDRGELAAALERAKARHEAGAR